MPAPSHIGIVGGSAEGAALCYRTICQEGASFLGPDAHPEVTMHTLSLAAYNERIERGDWQGVGEMLLESAGKLAEVGAAFLICPDNTFHQALPFIQARLPLPWLHIAEVVSESAAGRGFRKVGILGTRSLVNSEVYPGKLAARGIDCVRPESADRDEIHRIIMEELVRGHFKPEAIATHQRVIAGMKDEECEAVILGCTEIPLIMNDGNSPLPTLDSTRLLAREALKRSCARVP